MGTFPCSVDKIGELAVEAGQRIMDIYASDYAVTHKEDHSPLTEADMAAHRIIEAGLQQITPGRLIISEESEVFPDVADEEAFWLVDPLDGTKSFISRSGEFTVNIAYIVERIPIMGVVYVPATARLYGGVAGEGAFLEADGSRQEIRTRSVPAEGLEVMISSRHALPKTQAYLDELAQPVQRTIRASSSLKFCIVAEGRADLYPRFGPTMEWDTAAGQAVLEAAGGAVLMADGRPFRYAKPAFRNDYFIACGDSSALARRG